MSYGLIRNVYDLVIHTLSVTDTKKRDKGPLYAE